MEPDTMPPGHPPGESATPEGKPYEPSSIVGAILLTIFMPFIALIAALLIRGSERDPARKAQLGTWAAASGAYLAVGLLIGVAIFASVASGTHGNTKGPCLGGPEIGATAEPLGGARYRIPCAGGGSEVVYFPEGGSGAPLP
jgi:hypothetical protein